jgi:hypothetical protein
VSEHKSQSAFKLYKFQERERERERERELNVAGCDLESSTVSKQLLRKLGEKFAIPLSVRFVGLGGYYTIKFYDKKS